MLAVVIFAAVIAWEWFSRQTPEALGVYGAVMAFIVMVFGVPNLAVYYLGPSRVGAFIRHGSKLRKYVLVALICVGYALLVLGMVVGYFSVL